MADDSTVYKVLHKIKDIIGIKKQDDIKILNETDNKLSDDITLKTVIILITCVTTDDGKI